MSDNTFLVVIDPARDTQPALERAIQATQLTGGKLHLFECVNESYNGKIAGNTEQHKKAILSEYQHQMEPMIDRAKLLGINVSHELVWAKNWSQAIVDAAKQSQCNMVFKSSYVHSRAERISNTADWSLLRNCHCPVLLMHHNSAWENRRVLAAINMAATDAKHIALNKKIIQVAYSFQKSYNAAVHFVNAYNPTAPKKAADDDFFYDEVDTPNPSCVELSSESLATFCDAETENVHLLPGPPDEAILRAANSLSVDLVIVGSVKRRGMKGRVIGNTAEKLLDRTTADILSLP